jgi:hypothetical protein
MRVRVIRLEAESLLVAGDCIGWLIERLVRDAKIVVQGDIARIGIGRPAQEIDSRVVVTMLVRQHAQEIQRAGIFRILINNLPAQRLCLRRIAHVLMPHGKCEKIAK